MLLKRSIVLAAGVLLFIAAFIIYFDVTHAQMEKRFEAEREKFGVQGAILTASGPANATTAPAPAPTPAPDSTEAPVSPATPVAPDTNSAPAPAAPDTNSAPAPSSTMNDPGASHSPFLVLASYRPSDDAQIQMADLVTGQAAAPSATAVTTPATNAASVAAPAPGATNLATTPSPATNAAPATPTAGASVAAHPVPGDGKVIVLLYHQFKAPGVLIPPKFQWTLNADVFESEMKYIHDNGYHVIPMSDLLKFLKHQITLPSNSVCITIDDGYKSAIVYAAPILKKYGYPWTFFIYPDFITTGEGPGAASWNDLLELQKEGIDIESHSMTHPQLTHHKQLIKKVWHNLSPEEYAQFLTNETAGAKAILEQKMGKPITCFAYPYGDYNKQVEAAAIAAGYEAIFTVADNPVHASTNPHSIGRYTITQGVVKDFPAYLRQGALGLDAADPAPGTTTSNPRPVITATLGYAGTLDPKSIETQVLDFGEVRHDFDPQTNTLRLYLPRDLIAPVVQVYIRVKDAATGQFMVANWRFNYELGAGATTPIHPPIAPAPATNSPSASTQAPAPASKTTASATTTTNAPAATEPDPMEKSAAGTPLDAHPVPPVSPTPPASPTPPRD